MTKHNKQINPERWKRFRERAHKRGLDVEIDETGTKIIWRDRTNPDKKPVTTSTAILEDD